MNRKQLLILRPLLAILGVLAVAVLLVSGIKYRAARNQPNGVTPAQGAVARPSTFSAISYWNGTETLSFSVDEAGLWIWSDDPSFPLDDGVISAMAEALATLSPQQTIATPEALDTYGLDDPSATLSATAADGSVLKLTFGKTTTDGNSYYMLKNGVETTVYTVADSLLTQMNTPIYDMAALPAMPAMTKENLESVTLSAEKNTTTLTAVRERDAEGNLLPGGTVFWKINGVAATTEDTDAVLADLGAMTVTKCVNFKPSAQGAKLCGFSAPAATMQAVYRTEAGSEQTFSLTFGAAAPAGVGRYIRMGEDPSIYLTPQEGVNALLAAAKGSGT